MFTSLLLIISKAMLLLFVIDCRRFLPLLIFKIVFLLFFRVCLVGGDSTVGVFGSGRGGVGRLVGEDGRFGGVGSVVGPCTLVSLSSALFRARHGVST